MLKKFKVDLVLVIAMLSFAAIVAFICCRQSRQAAMSIPLSLQFLGEYDLDSGEWRALSEETDLSAYDGDLVLRGRLEMELPEGAQIKFYLNHISMNLSMNGENIYESSQETYPDMCGNAWVSCVLPALTAGDQIEIRLHNPHSYGNRDAYNEFMDSIYLGSDAAFKYYFDRQGLPYRMICIFMVVVSIALIGTAVGYQLSNLPNGSLLLKLGIMSLLMGVYMYFDAKDISLQSNRMVINTFVRQLAIMLASWILGMGVTELLKEKRKKAAEIAVYALMFADFVFMALALAGVMRIYDTGSYWAVIQGIVSLFLLVLCIMEVRDSGKSVRLMLLSGMILLTALPLELVNAYMGWWQSGICIKVVFTVLFVFQLVWAIWLVAKNHQNSIRADKLREELKNSRIVLAMSQIRTHFIFNILNAISGMCGYDPEKADETLVMFSRYLRSNINIMEEDEPETFTKSLEHLEDYIRLEQIRFGSKIQFVKIIEAENFNIPPLVLQPVVENAIKHGLLNKTQGGTIRLHTWEENGYNVIEIFDDGVGFDTECTPKEGAVGIKNVRFRLECMVNGTIDVKSNPGEGTTVTITIPKA